MQNSAMAQKSIIMYAMSSVSINHLDVIIHVKLTRFSQGSNPWKVITLCEEIGIPYEIEYLKYADLGQRPFTDINPNGKVLAMQAPK
jgi:hypothetical protein